MRTNIPNISKIKPALLCKPSKKIGLTRILFGMRQNEMRLNAQKDILETRKRVKDIWDRYRVQKGAMGLREYEKMTVEEKQRIKRNFSGR